VMQLEPDSGHHGTVLARFAQGMPALLLRERSKGRVVLWASSIDRDWTDLPLRPGFLPLASAIVTYLGGSSTGVVVRSLVTGASLQLPASAGLQLRAGAGSWRAVARGRKSYTFARPGRFLLRQTDDHRVVAALAVNGDPRESMLRRGRLPQSGKAGSASSGAPARKPLWHVLGLLLIVLLLVEGWLIRR
jgi:hypothetical protein